MADCIYRQGAECSCGGNVADGLPCDGRCPFSSTPDMVAYCSSYRQPSEPSPDGSRTASWEDVKAKGEAIYANGGVEIIEDTPEQVYGLVMSGVVEGMFPVHDGGPYDTILSKRTWENQRNVGGWIQGYLCSCEWGKWHSGQPGDEPHYVRFCFEPDSLVLMADGSYKKICDIEPGDMVESKTGPHRVNGIFENDYDGEMVEVLPSCYGFPIRMTADHRVLTNPSFSESFSGRQLVSTYDGSGYLELESDSAWSGFKEAGKLGNVDFVLTKSASSIEAMDEIDFVSMFGDDIYCDEDDKVYWVSKKQRDSRGGRWHTMSPINRRIPFDCDLAFVLGLYLAEGSIEGHDGNHNIVRWSFGNTHVDLVNRLVSVLGSYGCVGAKAYDYSYRNCTVVKVSSQPLAELCIRFCGVGSRTKRLSREIMLADPKWQKSFLSAYCAGDGSPKDKGVYISTSSEILVRQVNQLIQRVYGVDGTVHGYANVPGPKSRSEGDDSKRLRIWHVSYGMTFQRKRHSALPFSTAHSVSVISRYHKTGKVYNLEVDGDHTYCVEGLVVHNCSHAVALLLASGARARQDFFRGASAHRHVAECPNCHEVAEVDSETGLCADCWCQSKLDDVAAAGGRIHNQLSDAVSAVKVGWRVLYTWNGLEAVGKEGCSMKRKRKVAEVLPEVGDFYRREVTLEYRPEVLDANGLSYISPEVYDGVAYVSGSGHVCGSVDGEGEDVTVNPDRRDREQEMRDAIGYVDGKLDATIDEMSDIATVSSDVVMLDAYSLRTASRRTSKFGDGEIPVFFTDVDGNDCDGLVDVSLVGDSTYTWSYSIPCVVDLDGNLSEIEDSGWSTQFDDYMLDSIRDSIVQNLGFENSFDANVEFDLGQLEEDELGRYDYRTASRRTAAINWEREGNDFLAYPVEIGLAVLQDDKDRTWSAEIFNPDTSNDLWSELGFQTSNDAIAACEAEFNANFRRYSSRTAAAPDELTLDDYKSLDYQVGYDDDGESYVSIGVDVYAGGRLLFGVDFPNLDGELSDAEGEYAIETLPGVEDAVGAVEDIRDDARSATSWDEFLSSSEEWYSADLLTVGGLAEYVTAAGGGDVVIASRKSAGTFEGNDDGSESYVYDGGFVEIVENDAGRFEATVVPDDGPAQLLGEFDYISDAEEAAVRATDGDESWIASRSSSRKLAMAWTPGAHGTRECRVETSTYGIGIVYTAVYDRELGTLDLYQPGSDVPDYSYDVDSLDEADEVIREQFKPVASRKSKRAAKAGKTATRKFTYAEMRELDDEIEGKELSNADRLKDDDPLLFW